MINTRLELLDRLDHFALIPKAVLDIGGCVAQVDNALQRRFPLAQIIVARSSVPGVALAEQPTHIGGFRALYRKLLGKPRLSTVIEASMDRIPLADYSVDVIVADQWAPGVGMLDAALSELHRVLVEGGLFLCTTPSPVSLVGQADMHDLGSALMRAGFIEPVLDVDRAGASRGEIIHVAAFAGVSRRQAGGSETVVPFPSSSRRR